jgi:glutaredoxin-like YruB-family protein
MAREFDVTIYTTPTCSWCAAVKRLLEEHEIEYTEHDVSEDEDAAERLIRLSGQTGVPVLDIDGEIVVGFDRARIVELLGLEEA